MLRLRNCSLGLERRPGGRVCGPGPLIRCECGQFPAWRLEALAPMSYDHRWRAGAITEIPVLAARYDRTKSYARWKGRSRTLYRQCDEHALATPALRSGAIPADGR